MQARTQLKRTIILTLEEHEAAWLHALMQNPFTEDGDPSKETEDVRRLRESFFYATAVRD